MNRHTTMLLVSALLVMAGCGSSDSGDALPADSSGGAFGAYSQMPAAAETPPGETDPAAPAPPVANLPPADEPPSLVTVDDFVRGQILRDSEHAMSRLAGAIPTTEQRMLLEVQIPQALNLYRAEKGYFPKSHDIFMRDIIAFNQLKLPQLKPGYEYWFDSETGQLMKRPASAAAE